MFNIGDGVQLSDEYLLDPYSHYVDYEFFRERVVCNVDTFIGLCRKLRGVITDIQSEPVLYYVEWNYDVVQLALYGDMLETSDDALFHQFIDKRQEQAGQLR